MTATKAFKNDGTDFSALEAARDWCRQNGFSMGSLERGQPIGVHKDAEYISKWTRMTAEEQAELDGRLEAAGGLFRSGDVTLYLKGEVPNE